MTKLINSRPFWGLRPSAEEFSALEATLGIQLRNEIREAIEVEMFDYSWARATLDQGVRPADLRRRLRSIAKSCRDAAALLGGQEWFDDDHSALSPPRNWLPREGLALEARHEIHRALMWRDHEVQKRYGTSPNLAQLEPGEVAWRLSHIARAADVAAEGMKPGKGGRPDGGGRGLVRGLLRELNKNGAKLSCKLDPVEGTFVGTFVNVAAWLTSVGVQAQESTLCQYAAEEIRAGALHKKKPRGQRRVHS